MKRLGSALIGIAALSALLVFAGTHYVALTPTTTTVLSKEQFSLSPLVLDIRDWTPLDVARHPDIAAIFVKQGKGSLLPGGSVARGLAEGARAAATTVRGLGTRAADSARAIPGTLRDATSRAIRKDVIRDAQPVLQALTEYALDHACEFPVIQSLDDARTLLVPKYIRRIPPGIRVTSTQRSFSIRGVEGTVAAEMGPDAYPAWRALRGCRS